MELSIVIMNFILYILYTCPCILEMSEDSFFSPFVFVLQVLVGSAGLEEDAPAGRSTEGAGHLG